MDQQRTPVPPPFDDLHLDDAPELTARDEVALDAIRRQLAEEYPSAVVAPLPDEPATAPAAVHVHVRWPWPLLGALLVVAAGGGGVVGAMVTAHVLREPPAIVALHTLADPRSPDPEGASRHDTLPARAAPPPSGPADGMDASPTPPPPRTPRAASSRRSQARPAPNRPLPGAPQVSAERPTATRPKASPPSAIAASPTTAPVAGGNAAAPTAGGADNGTLPVAAPEPQRWSETFRPLQAETAAHAGIAKAAFESSRASPVPAPAPPPTAPPLQTYRAVPPPAAAPSPAAPRPSQVPEIDGVLETIREDWKTVRSGFASAPEDFRQAWRAFTRDVKDLLNR